MSEQVFLIAFIIAATTIVLTVKSIAGAVIGRKTTGDVRQLADQIDQNAAALEEAQHNIASQAQQLAELQERVDFAERMLAQSRERGALKPGDPNG